MQARAAKRQKNKELRNFYKHASKENKLVKLQELRDKFEADKEKQKKLIADRKFRPAQNCVKQCLLKYSVILNKESEFEFQEEN